MPYLGGVAGFSSIFSFATTNLPAYSLATSSKIGAIALQGPHHSAQKSTRTGVLLLILSLSYKLLQREWVLRMYRDRENRI